MAHYFFDTSAVGKRYHAEIGTARVNAILTEPNSTCVISRLSVVELHSVLAKKVRTGQLARDEFEKATRQFRSDVAAKRLRVARLLTTHFTSAERLIRRIGPQRNLRTLDALQLAVVLSLQVTGQPISFVCADLALCAIASSEGLTVVNPEIP